MRKIFSILSVLFFIGASAQPNNFFWQQLRVQGSTPPPLTRTGLVFVSLFENIPDWQATTLPVELGQPWGNQQHCCAYSIAPAPIARFGTGAAKFELRAGDPPVSGAPRSEITGPDFPNTVYETWLGISIYVVNVNGNDASVVQWHHNNNVSIPPMAMWITGGRFSLVHTAEGQGINNIYSDLAPVTLNVWNDFVFHIKFTNSTATSGPTAGLIEVWKNDVLLYTYTGVTGYTGGNYYKNGIYQWNGVLSTQIAYIDEVRIGNSTSNYVSVRPGIY